MAFLEVAGGVVLGGAISAGTTWALERRREQRAQVEDAVVLKSAARIAYTDMGVIRRNLRQVLKDDRWVGFLQMPLTGWQQQGYRLAAVLPPRDYEAVAHTFARAGDLERGFKELLSSNKAALAANVLVVNLDDQIRPTIEKLVYDTEAACVILGEIAYAGDELGPDMESFRGHDDPPPPLVG